MLCVGIIFIKIFTDKINPPKRVKRGCVEDADTSEVAGGYSPAWSLLLLRFVVYEDSNLRLAGSDSYLAEVFPRYQCRHYDG